MTSAAPKQESACICDALYQFLSNSVSVQGSDTVTRNKVCFHKEMRQRYFGVTMSARWSP